MMNKRYIKLELPLFAFAALIIINTSCSSENKKSNLQLNKKLIQEKVFSHIDLNYDSDSIYIEITINNESESDIYYPCLDFMINDQIPWVVYYPRLLNNGNIINFLPNIKNAEGSLFSFSEDDGNICPIFYTIEQYDSLRIKMAAPIEYYKKLYFESSYHIVDTSEYKLAVEMFLISDYTTASKNGTIKHQNQIQYKSFNIYNIEKPSELIEFPKSDKVYDDEFYNLFERYFFLTKCDTIIDVNKHKLNIAHSTKSVE